MGGASSKAARRFPKTTKTAKPSWAGTRTPSPSEPRAEPTVSSSIPPEAQRASEARTEAIERDAQDPQFLAKLNQLGPVKVDHHMRTFRPAEHLAQHVHQTRLRSEMEASAQPAHNHLVATSLSAVLEELKYTASQEGVIKLANRYDIDVEKLQSLAQFVNTPTVDPNTIVREVADDGTEKITMKVMWKDASASR